MKVMGTPFIALGIDYGKKSIGVAAGQSLTGTATELVTLRCNETRKSRTRLLEELKKIIVEWQPAVIVLGWPLNMDGSESDFCEEVKAFSRQLEQASGKRVMLMDERLTSREAKSLRNQQAGFRENPVDSLAAKILLESWFRTTPNVS
jgi:putative Holliday junction resolvase